MPRLSGLDGEFDLLIAGGGIVGAGIARDAALRGLRVALFEKSDFGGGTTSGSTRLIHGGLRYLEMLDFHLVRLDLREREILLRLAPHLVKPLEFLIPFYDRNVFYRAKLGAGLALYDLLSFDKSLPNHRILSAAETLRAEPGLRARGLQGAAAYFDAQVDSPERLCLENILDARAHGAVTLNYVEVTGGVYRDGRLAGVRVRDTLEGDEHEVHGRAIVNAAGPWFDRLAPRLGPHPRPLIRTTKGVHLACAPPAQRATVLFSPIDGRLFFVIPWLGYSWVGTTDTDFEGDPAEAAASPEDVEYLTRSARNYFPNLGKVYWTNAGVRALVAGKGAESAVSRLHRITRTAPGLISVLGGKITGYRAVAEEAVDLACRELGVRRASVTAGTPFPARARPETPADATFAARHEMCLRLSDFMLRRSLLGFAPDRGLHAATPAARLLARELGWSAPRTAGEIEEYKTFVQRSRPRRDP